ncbi:methyltransferase type 11 [Streptomyces sp. CB02923]|uniref:SAM-dependent methyltransferase n=1 Tax=Streptomyces sp. CB02923 TaxID=1718985 RepID=UPI00093DB05B|nr:methyltransferase domain-containing protein [Streptomyces sp. CB02923]OKI05044.1 methyltransferase type 11 [Streptomyces sp. CB02923]
MTVTDSSASNGPAPAPEEVGAMYDRFGDLLAMVLGSSALHVGMFVPHGERTGVTSLLGLSDLAQDRQTDYLADILADGLPPDARLLDIGCGTGGPAIRLAQRTGGRVTGITVSNEQLARCEERLSATTGLGDRVDYTYGNVMQLGYADNSFDAAWSIDCFAHLSDRPAGLREALRVLRPGGHLLMTEFTRRGATVPPETQAFTQLWTSPPPTTFATLSGEVEEAGFRIARIQNMTSNIALCGELMYVLYKEQRDAIEQRFGKEATAHTDPLMEPFRTYCRHHVDYYLLLLGKPES